MRRLRPDEDPPSWLLHAPTAHDRRMHFVLVEPACAITVEVLGSRFLSRYQGDGEAVESVPWKLRFPRIISWHRGGGGSVPDTLMSYRRKGCEAWLAQRGTSWLQIAIDLYDGGDLEGGTAGEPLRVSDSSVVRVVEGKPLSVAPPLAELGGAQPAAEATSLVGLHEEPPTKRSRTECVGSSTLAAPVMERLRAARKLFKQQIFDAALVKFRQAAVLAEQPSSAGGGDGEEAAADAPPVDIAAVRSMTAALSGVAGTLERRAQEEGGGRALGWSETREALSMRVRAFEISDDAVKTVDSRTDGRLAAQAVRDLRETAEAAQVKLRTMLERDEAKDLLHGLLVARMDRLQAMEQRRNSNWRKELDERPDDRRW